MICNICDTFYEGHKNTRYCSKDCKMEFERRRKRKEYHDAKNGITRKNKRQSTGERQPWGTWRSILERRVWNTYGLYLDEYKAMMELGCAICGEEAKHMDHDHKTGRVREALCVKHNIAVGYFELEEAEKVQEYLVKWS